MAVRLTKLKELGNETVTGEEFGLAMDTIRNNERLDKGMTSTDYRIAQKTYTVKRTTSLVIGAVVLIAGITLVAVSAVGGYVTAKQTLVEGYTNGTNQDWSAWSKWSSCSVSCGIGTKSRTRTCLLDEPRACQGETVESDNCIIDACCGLVSPAKKEAEEDLPTFERNGWELIFRATAGNGKDVYDAWTKGQSVTTIKPSSMKRSMDKHYLNKNFVNDWDARNVTRVKIALYENEIEVINVTFRTRRPLHPYRWFQQANILSSSWPSLTPTEQLNAFSAIGWSGNSYDHRIFYISKKHGGCKGDAGYLFVADVSRHTYCGYEKFMSYPQFLYSKDQNGSTTWSERMYGTAHYFTIFVKHHAI